MSEAQVSKAQVSEAQVSEVYDPLSDKLERKETTFLSDKALSLKSSPLMDILYTKHLDAKKIHRYSAKDKFVLDQEYHIDCIVKTHKGNAITLQEKGLRHKFIKYNTFTMEYYQNRFNKEGGEYFNLCSQMYFHGYLNEYESAFEKWCILDVCKLMQWINTIPYIMNSVRDDKFASNASFFYVDYKSIPDDVFIIDRCR